MSLRPKLQNIQTRRWSDVRDAWLASVPVFGAPGTPPDPGLERLAPLQALPLPENKERYADVQGLRRNLLWEAVFLFHKCAHTHLAAQRLGSSGMHSWAMFNAYHSAFLGARGVLALLGVGLPYLPNGGQLLIDVYPQPESRRDKKALRLGDWKFQEFVVVRMPRLDQQGLWETFQRCLQISEATSWDARIRQELLDVSLQSITRPRNSFLYKAAFWPGQDLMVDQSADGFASLVGSELRAEETGFLLRLSCCVYKIFEELVTDLVEVSNVIREQVDKSRIASDPSALELLPYNTFLAGRESAGMQL